MSDIQRYFPYLYMFKTDDEEKIKEYHTDVYVKYDDHIAEVDKVKYNLEEDKQCLKEDIEKLQARIDELEAMLNYVVRVHCVDDDWIGSDRDKAFDRAISTIRQMCKLEAKNE